MYKQPNITEQKLNDLADVFLIGTSIQDLPPSQASQARNLTAEIFILQQSNQNVTFNLEPAPTAGASGEQGGGGAVTPNGGSQRIEYPIPTDAEGDYDGFVQINDTGLDAGNSTSEIQRLNIYTEGDVNGNATGYLVPPTGLGIISDIDDILRITQIYEPSQGLLNSFAKPFTPWMNMPDIYANWSRSLPNFWFHYLTTTPEQVTRNYMDFIYKTYPGGSFDTRPLNFSDVGATLSIRKFLLDKVFQTFPQRKFILMADTSNSDVMRDYPAMATDYPGQVQCIFLRNTSNTDPGDKFPYDTSGFKNLNSSTYMFFVVPVSFTPSPILSAKKLKVVGRPQEPGHRQRTMRQLDDPAESHFRLSGFTWWLQPRRRQERIRKPGGSLDHVGVRSCSGSGGVGTVRLRKRWISKVACRESWSGGRDSCCICIYPFSTVRFDIV